MAFAKGHAKFQANPRIRSRVKVVLMVPIRMQYAICRYFGHKIGSISLNFRDNQVEKKAFAKGHAKFQANR